MSLATRTFLRKLRPQSRTGWIGVDIGSQSVKLVQLELSNGAPQIREAVSVPLPSSATLSEASLQSGWLAELLRDELSLRSGFRGRHAACVLSMSVADFRSVNLPPATSKETRDMIAQELSDSGLGGHDTLEFDFWDGTRTSNEPDSTTTVNVLSVSRGVATQLAQQLHDAGLTCEVLDGGPFALARSVQLATGSQPESSVLGVLDWSGSGAQFTVVVNGEPAFTRLLKDCGVRHVIDAIRAGLELSMEDSEELLATHGIPHPGDDKAAVTEVQELVAEVAAEPFNRLINELEKTASYLVSQRPELAPKALWFVGGGAAIRNAAARLTFATGIPIRSWSLPRRSKSTTGPAEQPVGLFAQAAALSLLGFES